MMFAFAGQIFQFVARPGYVDNYGFNFTLWHPLNLWKAQNDTFENLVLGPKCIRPKLFWAEVFSGRSINGAEVFPGPKCASGRSMLGAKLSVGQSDLGAKLGVSPSQCSIYFQNCEWYLTENFNLVYTKP